MTHRFSFRPSIAKTASVAALAVLLGACASRPPVNPDLEAARDAVGIARSNPYTARAAAIELERAQQALARAESAWAGDRDPDETRHLAYLAKRRADIALAMAAQARADERLAQAGAEAERIRLEARTREAEAAAQRARVAQATAQSAQSAAQASQQQAQAAQEQAQAAQARAAQQAQRAQALERDLAALQAKTTQRGMVVTLSDVLFQTGRATLQPGAQRSVEKLAGVLQQYPERRVLIEGFTDSTGSEEANLELSQRRAEAFRQALVNQGVSGDRVEVRAHGEAFPVADNDTAAGRQLNRRVEVLFSDAQGQFMER